MSRRRPATRRTDAAAIAAEAADLPLPVVLAVEGAAGASACGLRRLAEGWPDKARRAHLQAAVQNGARLDGRGWRMVPRRLTGGDAIFEFVNPARRGSEGRHFARVSVLRGPDGQPLVTAECEADPCESWQFVGWCRHAEHACRLVEATWQHAEGLERAEDLDEGAFWACARVRAQTPPLGAPEVGEAPAPAMPARNNAAPAPAPALPRKAVRRGGYAAAAALATGAGRGFDGAAGFAAAVRADFGD